MVANKYAFLQITRRRFLNEWEAFKKVVSRRKIGRAVQQECRRPISYAVFCLKKNMRLPLLTIDAAAISAGDTAWVLASTALVMVMTVGLSCFYGGLVRPKNALNTMMMSVVALGLISVQWVLVGYSIAFGHGSPLWGGLAWLGFRGVGVDPDPAYAATIPLPAHAMFQLLFAILTPALISGAIVERMRFRAYVVFLLLWATFIYD